MVEVDTIIEGGDSRMLEEMTTKGVVPMVMSGFVARDRNLEIYFFTYDKVKKLNIMMDV